MIFPRRHRAHQINFCDPTRSLKALMMCFCDIRKLMGRIYQLRAVSYLPISPALVQQLEKSFSADSVLILGHSNTTERKFSSSTPEWQKYNMLLFPMLFRVAMTKISERKRIIRKCKKWERKVCKIIWCWVTSCGIALVSTTWRCLNWSERMKWKISWVLEN